MYQWKVVFDITKYEISKELKSDFAALATHGKKQTIEYEVIFNGILGITLLQVMLKLKQTKVFHVKKQKI